MTKKNGIERPIGIGEISTIRQILMGEQFKEFEKQMLELRADLDEMRSEFDHTINELRGVIKESNKSLKMDTLKKFVELENRLVKYQDKTSSRIKKDKEAETARLSRLFLKIGKELGEK